MLVKFAEMNIAQDDRSQVKLGEKELSYTPQFKYLGDIQAENGYPGTAPHVLQSVIPLRCLFSVYSRPKSWILFDLLRAPCVLFSSSMC